MRYLYDINVMGGIGIALKQKKLNDLLADYSLKINKDEKFSNIFIFTNQKNSFFRNKLQTEIYNLAKINFYKIGKRMFINDDTKEVIYVSNADIKESIAKTVRNAEQKKMLAFHIEIFGVIDKIIINGKLFSRSLELKNRDCYLNWRYYVTNVYINNIKYLVQFDVVLRSNSEKHFRIERIIQFNRILKKQETSTEKILINQ